MVSIGLNAILFCLLRIEKQNDEKLEAICKTFAYSAKEQFADYAEQGNDASYWKGVAEFRGYMQSYHLQMEDEGGGDYIWLSQLYGNLLLEKDRVSMYMEELRKALRLLSEDIYSHNGLRDISERNNCIRYGA